MNKNKQRTLENLFEELEIEEVLDNAEVMGYNPDKRLDRLEKPELIRKELARAILDDPKTLLRQLPAEDLMLLHILRNAEPGMGMRAYHTSQVMSMALLGVAEQSLVIEDDSMEMISITEDFKQAIRPCFDEVVNDFEVKLRLHVEEFLIGALNLYGILTRSELKAILKECLDLEDDGSGMFNHIYPYSITLKLQEYDGYFHGGEDFFLSPFVLDYGSILREQEKRKEVTSLKHFDRDTLRKAGEMPIPVTPNCTSGKLLKTLQNKLGYTEPVALFQQFQMWQMIQEENLSTVLQMIIENAPKKLNGLNELNDVVQILTEFLNNAPRWIFRGRCPNDLQKPLTSAPSITLGPNMQNMGFRQEDVQQLANDAWAGGPFFYPGAAAPFAKTNKIGRNDPCPCGSGKKYKNCCGKN